MTTEPFNRIAAGEKLNRGNLIQLLSSSDEDELKHLYELAYELKVKHVGNKVYFRGIVEFSNICEKDCLYCGIRKSNKDVERFMMSEEEIITSALWAHENGYGSIVLQSGENTTGNYIDFITQVLQKIKSGSNGKLGVTLSLGEQSRETYQEWFDAGAHRYLLRIESSNEKIYHAIHPENHRFSHRLKCLEYLRDIGYQVGTGVMIGLPNQTEADLADDILFFEKMDIDMIGMGPYLPHNSTPMGQNIDTFNNDAQLEMGLKMIAVVRCYLRDVNIAATTALQALNPTGRELGLQAGANIIMPNVTETKYRAVYQLYQNKPCIDENTSMCKGCLQRRIDNIGESIGFNEWGDSPHFLNKTSM